ncbi:hypothetical protein B0J12DRAFT_315868 [Macrophomina phaseolina]|uniref:Uncharacterized protein n=1 Tax=Macrophomina phaseolina TaxID=35725 RepID=A0ABQ8FXF6_9PEZI|nr:hypothetical protein B0J12DRAFT_315868 [Macrophomina phaseolina]
MSIHRTVEINEGIGDSQTDSCRSLPFGSSSLTSYASAEQESKDSLSLKRRWVSARGLPYLTASWKRASRQFLLLHFLLALEFAHAEQVQDPWYRANDREGARLHTQKTPSEAAGCTEKLRRGYEWHFPIPLTRTRRARNWTVVCIPTFYTAATQLRRSLAIVDLDDPEHPRRKSEKASERNQCENYDGASPSLVVYAGRGPRGDHARV